MAVEPKGLFQLPFCCSARDHILALCSQAHVGTAQPQDGWGGFQTQGSHEIIITGHSIRLQDVLNTKTLQQPGIYVLFFYLRVKKQVESIKWFTLNAGVKASLLQSIKSGCYSFFSPKEGVK